MPDQLKHSSKTSYRPEFASQFADLADAAKPVLSRVIRDLIDNYAGRPWAYGEDHDAITCDYIPPQDAWRIKVKEGPADHRIYVDLADDNTLVFLTVYHKDDE